MYAAGESECGEPVWWGIGEADGRITRRAQAIADAFNSAGLTTTVSDNIVGTVWEKLLINVATGAITGITRVTYGQLYDEPVLKAASLAAIDEAMTVAKAAGITLSIDNAEDARNMAAEGLSPAFETSMLQSLEKSSVTEIDFVNGAVVRWGERHERTESLSRTRARHGDARNRRHARGAASVLDAGRSAVHQRAAA